MFLISSPLNTDKPAPSRAVFCVLDSARKLGLWSSIGMEHLQFLSRKCGQGNSNKNVSSSYTRNIKTTANQVEFDKASTTSNLKPASRHCFGLLTFLLTSNDGVKCAMGRWVGTAPQGHNAGSAHKDIDACLRPPPLHSLVQRLLEGNLALLFKYSQTLIEQIIRYNKLNLMSIANISV